MRGDEQVFIGDDGAVAAAEKPPGLCAHRVIARQIRRDDAGAQRFIAGVDPDEFSVGIQTGLMEGVQVLRDGIGRDVLVVVDAGEEIRLGLLEQGQLAASSEGFSGVTVMMPSSLVWV